MAEDRLRLEASWKAALRGEFEEPYMQKLRAFLAAEKRAGKKIFPPGPEMFAALDSTPLDAVKVVRKQNFRNATLVMPLALNAGPISLEADTVVQVRIGTDSTGSKNLRAYKDYTWFAGWLMPERLLVEEE